MKRKAAIITWCYDNGCSNYGQILQCYAMQNICIRLGLDPLVIKYRQKTEQERIKRRFPFPRANQLYEKRFIIKEVERNDNRRIRLFFQFIEQNINLSNPCYSRQEIEWETRDCDILICGSDQIWNPVWFDPIYALDFGTKEQRRISYAPSGISKEDFASQKKYRELAGYLKRFHAISVRERSAAEVLKKYTEKDVVDVLDPTFLVSAEEWNLVAAKKLVKEPYIFCYTLGNIRPYKIIVKRLMQMFGAVKVVYIPSNLLEANDGNTGDFIAFEDAGPAEFLSLIKYAKAVCTDSFHGMALSINYKKQFCILERAQRGIEGVASAARQDNILEKLHLENRKVKCLKDLRGLEEIDYSKVEQSLRECRLNSWIFIESAIMKNEVC